MLVNWAYLRGLSPGITGSEAAAANLMSVFAVDGDARFVSLLVRRVSITSANATVLSGAHTNYALCRDFRLFDFLGTSAPARRLMRRKFRGVIALLLVR